MKQKKAIIDNLLIYLVEKCIHRDIITLPVEDVTNIIVNYNDPTEEM